MYTTFWILFTNILPSQKSFTYIIFSILFSNIIPCPIDLFIFYYLSLLSLTLQHHQHAAHHHIHTTISFPIPPPSQVGPTTPSLHLHSVPNPNSPLLLPSHTLHQICGRLWQLSRRRIPTTSSNYVCECMFVYMDVCDECVFVCMECDELQRP